ncbi:hypothetical protein LTR53_009254 [Teratosphaeriaceae sp. CCFEE 6253]|nr:hypothetical protein LTR53_009254 [Teratosphaeriaceae sp. CCFEE 6253]
MVFDNHWHPDRIRMLGDRSSEEIKMCGDFDFGSGMPLPTSRQIKLEPQPHGLPKFIGARAGAFDKSPFRKLGRNPDAALVDYMRGRRTSPTFLNEIDQWVPSRFHYSLGCTHIALDSCRFLAAHGEIVQYSPQFADYFNSLPPLQAYLFFALPNLHNIPIPPVVVPIASVHDTELLNFFDGHEYRIDILMKIDTEVIELCKALYHGMRVNPEQRKLVVYAVFGTGTLPLAASDAVADFAPWVGHAIDAFKYYEYNYQTEWLHHRYLPEHVILAELPKRADRALPVPRQVDHQYESRRSHPQTRARMARANDQGVDVLEVLVDDFTSALCRKGLKRVEIERLRKAAIRNIDHMRATGDTRDIVDVVMGRATSNDRPPSRRPDKKTPTRLSSMEKLQRSLSRLVEQELALKREGAVDFVFRGVTRMRQRVERELVLEISTVAVKTGKMTHQRANSWREMFSKKWQESREAQGAL